MSRTDIQTDFVPQPNILSGNTPMEGPPLAWALVILGLLALVASVSWSTVAVRGVVLSVLLIIAALTDLRWGTVPNALTIAGALLGLALAIDSGWAELGTAFVAGAVAAVLLLGVRLMGHLAAGQPGMGYGDIKLGFVLGVFAGWNALWMLYLAAVVAGLFGIAGIASGLLRRRQRIPFAPFIAAGALAGYVFPFTAVINWLWS